MEYLGHASSSQPLANPVPSAQQSTGLYVCHRRRHRIYILSEPGPEAHGAPPRSERVGFGRATQLGVMATIHLLAVTGRVRHHYGREGVGVPVRLLTIYPTPAMITQHHYGRAGRNPV